MYLVIFVTTSNIDEAEKITQLLLEKRLAACINIIPCIHSRFLWKDKIERCDENLLIIKSKSNVLNELIKTIKEIHSYQVPEIIAIPIQSGTTKYFSWLNETIKDS